MYREIQRPFVKRQCCFFFHFICTKPFRGILSLFEATFGKFCSPLVFVKMSSSKSSSSTTPPAKRQKTSSSSSSSSTAAASIFSSTRCINRVPVEVWKEHICQKFLNLTELSILRRSHTFFEKYWQNVMAQKVMRVQVQVPGYPVPRAVAWRAPTTPRHQAQLRQIIEYSQYTLDGMSSLRVGHSISQKKK